MNNSLAAASEQMHLNPDLSGVDAIKLLEFINGCLSCETVREYTDMISRIQELFTFDYAVSALGYHDYAKGNVPVYHLNISFNEQWFREYMSRDYLRKSVVMKENFTAYKLQYWSDSWKKLRQEDEIVSLCMDFGLRQGIIHGSPPLLNEKYGSLFCFSSPSMKKDPRTAAMLELIIPHLHLALARIHSKQQSISRNVVLSGREKEVLDWLKQGKSSWDISVILGISKSTVNFHVYNIMNKLGAINRPQAVAVAAHLGLIDID